MKSGLSGRHRRVDSGYRRIGLLIDPSNRSRQRVALLQIQVQHEAVVIRQASMQRIVELRGGCLEPLVGEFVWVLDALAIIRWPVRPRICVITESSLMSASPAFF